MSSWINLCSMLEAIKESGLAACISGNCMVRFSIHFFPTLQNILCNRLSWLGNDPGLGLRLCHRYCLITSFHVCLGILFPSPVFNLELPMGLLIGRN